MTRPLLRNNRGVTLIELITAMAILSLVMVMVFSFLGYGNAAFSQGKAQNEAQTSLRIANDYIVKNVRFATSVFLTTVHPGVIAVTNEYDYIFIESNKIIHSAYNGGAARVVRQLADGIQAGTSFWSQRAYGAQRLGMTFHGQEAAQAYSLSSGIELPNVALKGNYIQDVSGARTIIFRHLYTISGNPPPPPGVAAYQVIVLASPSEAGVVAGSGTYDVHSSVSVTAIAEPGYTFVNWVEGGTPVSASSTYTFSATSNRILEATFEEVTLPPPVYNFTVEVVTNRTGNQDYRITLGSLPPKTTKSPYLVTFLNVIGGSYSLKAEIKSGNNWNEFYYDVVDINEGSIYRRIPDNLDP